MDLPLPPDVARLVHEHAGAATLQRAVRRWQLRHVHRAAWGALRRHLARAAPEDVALLTRNAAVRREWRGEPDSWVTCLADGTTSARAIASEVQAGLW